MLILPINTRVAKATAEELRSVGINWIMGPCLDVLTNVKNQPLGVRSTGDDPEEVSKYGAASLRGFQDAGIANCGKHFPSYGNLEFLGSSLDVPVITESLEQLSLSALIPFRNAIAQGVDSMMVGGCAMASAGVNAMHACLSEQVVDELLRGNLGFDGVVISECLEMEALSHNIGVGGGTVMSIIAGCDLILVCRSWTGQQEAINGLKVGFENSAITHSRLRKSLKRMLELKAKYMSWEKALTPEGIESLSILRETHEQLSRKAYNESITVVRNKDQLLPLSNILEANDELLLLSPLLKPLPASAAAQKLARQGDSPDGAVPGFNISGESIFRELGRSLARQRNGRVLHTSYTANGLRPVHEELINRASVSEYLFSEGLDMNIERLQSWWSRRMPIGTYIRQASPSTWLRYASCHGIQKIVRSRWLSSRSAPHTTLRWILLLRLIFAPMTTLRLLCKRWSIFS